MNIFQFAGILLYLASLTGYLYIFTNRFQKGWLGNIAKGRPFSNKNGYIDFRIFSVGTLAIVLIALKVLQDAAQ
jgi:hypothetical protein